MRLAATAFALALVAGPALSQAYCGQAADGFILTAPEWGAIHPEWPNGTSAGDGWILTYMGEQQGEDGEYFLYGDLVDQTGFVLSPGVWVWSMEWECDAY